MSNDGLCANCNKPSLRPWCDRCIGQQRATNLAKRIADRDMARDARAERARTLAEHRRFREQMSAGDVQ